MQCLSPKMNCKRLKIATKNLWGNITSESEAAPEFYSIHKIPVLHPPTVHRQGANKKIHL